ncbi:CDP-glycerol glycerophosphotransferase family protein [Virgibacillus halodenitrificans]|uniref:CDP-glycerol glycerophosphotransferase family protein n=1 Tax=Virgibacillus halodenitrificans TaxID=1482 RepID=UPI002DB6FD86|nr:CDP-glycerol glycerophosphotransferase family protein [Virgibacillus halodenitrificans]MEC2158526.1 CDP-glycerol glycerophosphotransferase family protein [Virgibacillus halodenitrificans]
MINILAKKKKNNKKNLKSKVGFYQANGIFKIIGSLNNENLQVSELWLFSREENIGYKIDGIEPNHDFSFEIYLGQLLERLEKRVDRVYDWYFKVRSPISESAKVNIEGANLVDIGGIEFIEYFMRCGRFKETYTEGITYYTKDENYLINYISQKGNLSLIVNDEPNTRNKIQIDKVKKINKTLRVEGKIFTKNSRIEEGKILLKGRGNLVELTSEQVQFKMLEKEVVKKFGLNRYKYIADIDLVRMNSGKLPEEDIYDLFLELTLHDNSLVKQVRVGRPTLRAKITLSDLYLHNNEESIIINPYYTFKKFNLSFETFKYPISNYKYMRRVIRWAWLIRLFNRKKDIWLIGERVYKAQDTGFAFFKFMRGNYPEKDIYYVIDKNSPEKKNIEQLGNVLEFKSKEHIWNTIIAKKVISSHHPDYLYPIRTQTFKNKVKADKVFLQHGVMGTKNMIANYGKQSPGFDTDLFMVSSDFEKEMIVKDFGYDDNQVFVTGLSRFDTLFKKDVKTKRQILIIPTWRDWIVTEEAFFESEYYRRYKELINNEKLYKLAEKFKFEIVFCLHPNMQKFSKYFVNHVVKIVNQGEIDVQSLIKESALMLTDYSSVGFDFSFLHKPVLYYQFDRDRFIGKRPSHLDLDNDLPGEVCFEEGELMNLIEQYAKNNFEMKLEYEERANKFIKYRDISSSERIFRVINENGVSKSILDNPKMKVLIQGLFNKYRKSKYYFPSMKLFYKIGSRVVPVNKKMILFESGLGKQLGDSPLNIYQEILNQDLDYEKVWVYNKNYRFSDDKTKKIKRLSPKYYYYLIKAGFWVNNQNFPSYIKKRPETLYLQTWHGTPLKKMLHDIENVQGRNDNYVERVSGAVRNWDYLISPSSYATEAFRSAFKYNGEVLEVGYPRNDIFYKGNQEETVTKVKNQLNIPLGKKVILYAPTFRDDQTTRANKFTFDVNLDLKKMKDKLGDEYIILLRMHVVISNKLVIEDAVSDFVRNVSSYPDMQKLLLLTDVLMTDYSSVMFDFANTEKPMLFYTYDLQNYKSNLRGFYIDFEKEAPGPLVYNTDEIIEKITNIQQVEDDYKDLYAMFYNKYCSLDDGNSSKRVVDRIFKRN